MDQNAGSSKQSMRKRSNLSDGQLIMIKHVYEGIRARNSNISVTEAVDMCSSLTQVSVSSVYRAIKKSLELNPKKRKVETRGRKKIEVDDDVKYTIRRIIYEFFVRHEIPTIKKIQAAIVEEGDIPVLSDTVLRRTMHHLNFRYLKQNSMLVEKDEIVVWRREYLEKLKEFRASGKKVYYVDETWINEGPGKGRRLIITHIGSDTGFLENGLHVFESRGTEDYHEDMNSDIFEKWFESVLSYVEPGAVIVMDNAPYHNRRVEKLPTSAWRKANIMTWLKSKSIEFTETMLKAQLLKIVQREKCQYIKYVVDEMAKARGIHILRLPPYHCEFNPLELIWERIKIEVAQNNTTFKLCDVRLLLQKAINNVTAETWRKCIGHAQNEEQRMWDLDTIVEVFIDPLIDLEEANSSDSDSNISTESDN